jgi:hypothetical protein
VFWALGRYSGCALARAKVRQVMILDVILPVIDAETRDANGKNERQGRQPGGASVTTFGRMCRSIFCIRSAMMGE